MNSVTIINHQHLHDPSRTLQAVTGLASSLIAPRSVLGQRDQRASAEWDGGGDNGW